VPRVAFQLDRYGHMSTCNPAARLAVVCDPDSPEWQTPSWLSLITSFAEFTAVCYLDWDIYVHLAVRAV
jgi:hypothetical protein